MNPLHAGYEKMAESLAELDLDEAGLRALRKTEWVVTEKIHGASFALVAELSSSLPTPALASPGSTAITFRAARRKAFLEPGEDFFGHLALLERIGPTLLDAFERIRAGHARGETWHAGFDELRNIVWRAWPLLPPAQQRRFLQRLRTWYDMHRFRAPPMTDERVRAAEALGQVRHRAARVQSVSAQSDGTLQARWTDASGDHCRCFDAVLNCTGLDAAAQVADNPLLASLRQQGRLQVDAAGIGFAVDAHGCAIDRAGRADAHLRLIGPPTAGTFGDPLGAMFIAAQVHRLLPHLLSTLESTSAARR